MQLNMKKFDLDSIPDGAICCFIGKRKSGKSFCIRDLLYHKQDIPMCKVVSGSEEDSLSKSAEEEPQGAGDGQVVWIRKTTRQRSSNLN